MTWWSQGTASLEQVFQDDWVEATMVLMIYLHNSQNIFANLMVAQMVKNLPAIRKTQVQSLGWEDRLEKGMRYPLQYSCLENFMDRGAWWATVCRVTKSWT